MSAFSTLKGVIEVDSSGVSDGINDAEDDLDSLSGRAQSTGQSMQRAGGMMTAGITAPLTAMGALSASAAADFDQSMQESIAVMGDVDDAMREDLEETAREVARTTTVSAEESAEAYYFLASAGLDAAQAMEAMPQVAQFATAGQMDMAEATDIATNVMSAYGYEAEEMTEVTDRMTATVSNHNQTMEGMSDALSRVAPTAAGTGVELGELNAAIGQLGDQGIQGQRAGTALNTAISQMSDETSPARQELEEMGVQVENAQGEMLPLADIFRQLEEAGADAGDMAATFGTQAGPAMAALLEQGGDALQENAQAIDEADDATEEMAETQEETLNAEMQIARDNIADVGIAIGSDLLPMLSTLTGYVSGAAERFQNLSERQRQAIIVVGGLAAVLGPLLALVGTGLVMLPAMATGWGMATTAAAGFSTTLQTRVVPAIYTTYAALGPIGLALGTLAVAMGALALAWERDWFSMRDRVEGAAGYIGRAIDWIIDQLNKIPGVDIDTGSAEDSLRDLAATSEETSDTVEENTEDDIEQDVSVEGADEEAHLAGVNDRDAYTSGWDDGDDEPIEGWSTEIRDALEDGVEGYTSDPDEIEEVPTELNDQLIDAVQEQEGEVTPDNLGVSEAEFNELMGIDGGTGGTGGQSPQTPQADSMDVMYDRQPSTSGSGSGRIEEKLDEVIQTLQDLGIDITIDADGVDINDVRAEIRQSEEQRLRDYRA